MGFTHGGSTPSIRTLQGAVSAKKVRKVLFSPQPRLRRGHVTEGNPGHHNIKIQGGPGRPKEILDTTIEKYKAVQGDRRESRAPQLPYKAARGARTCLRRQLFKEKVFSLMFLFQKEDVVRFWRKKCGRCFFRLNPDFVGGM